MTIPLWLVIAFCVLVGIPLGLFLLFCLIVGVLVVIEMIRYEL